MATVEAKIKYIRISPQKTREVAHLVRGKAPREALDLLNNLHKRPARHLAKAIASALANAKERKIDEETVYLKFLLVEEGPRFKRFRAASMGRSAPIVHRTSHIKVVLSDEPPGNKKKEMKKGRQFVKGPDTSRSIKEKGN